MNHDPVRLEIFKHLFAAIADEMGIVLRKSSFSPNIKERRDFSCAVFDAHGSMIAQAAHIPVHLGSMPLSVRSAIDHYPELSPGDAVLLNDPYLGGTHLPDITLVSPVYTPDGQLCGYVASRAHHADVGGSAPGSMSIVKEIYQEGLIIPPVKLFDRGKINQAVADFILANVRTPMERSGDLWAQISSNQRGVFRLAEMVSKYGIEETQHYMQELILYTERMTRNLLRSIPDGSYQFTDFLDDDGLGTDLIPISVAIKVKGDSTQVDFSGSAPQVNGSMNAVYAITVSAVYYVIRCLIGIDVPNNAGCLIPVEIIAPPGSVVNARRPAPVAGGNVETSQRIVDVLLGAFAQVFPDKIPAASQGTMNNLTVGGWDDRTHSPFAYYETIGGGMGARPSSDGPSAIHSHMTNTLNTPIEALEFAYPLRILRYQIQRNSGGIGRHRGGDGIRRDIQMLTKAHASLITERRKRGPYGLAGGEPGKTGKNMIYRNGEIIELPGKTSIELEEGDILSIQTPGGGGFGQPQ